MSTTTPATTSRLNIIVEGLRDIIRNDTYYANTTTGVLYDTKKSKLALFKNPISWHLHEISRAYAISIFHTCKANPTQNNKGSITEFKAPIYIHCYEKINAQDSDIDVMGTLNIWGTTVLKTILNNAPDWGLNIRLNKYDYEGQELFPVKPYQDQSVTQWVLQHRFSVYYDVVNSSHL